MIRSAGFIIFREDEGRHYLLLFTRNGMDFPKGHIEKGESEEQAARRETQEETGISAVKLIPGYREENKYYYMDRGRRTAKSVIFFLGQTNESKVTISFEHKGFKWCTPEEAIKMLRFKSQKQLIERAEEVLKK